MNARPTWQVETIGMHINANLQRILLLACGAPAFAQQPLSFEQIVQRFRTNNPSLQAGQLSIRENQANEVTAGLRPNPDFSLLNDQYQVGGSPLRPFSTTQVIPSVSQLIERRNKRGLRVESSKLATAGSRSDQQDLERNLLFSLRDAFNRVLRETGAYYLLGVEPDSTDADGRAHFLRVNVSQKGVTVRVRTEILIPRRTGATP